MSAEPGPDLLIGTRNAGKIREITEALKGLPVKLRTLNELAFQGTVEELGLTYTENAVIKAEFYSSTTGYLVVADDSGLEVSALNNRPGLYTARYGSVLPDRERCQLLLNEMEDCSDRSACFHCAAALSHRGVTRTVQSKCSGRIALHAAGTGGFGFDPIFIPDGYEQTFAQLPSEIKARISHRAQALMGIRRMLEADCPIAS